MNSSGLKYTTYLHIKEHVTNTMRRPIIFRRCKIIRWSAGFNKLMQQLPSYIAFVYWYLWHSLKIHLHLAQKIRKGHYGTTIDTLLLFTELLLRIVVVADTDVYWMSQSNDALIGWLFFFSGSYQGHPCAYTVFEVATDPAKLPNPKSLSGEQRYF